MGLIGFMRVVGFLGLQVWGLSSLSVLWGLQGFKLGFARFGVFKGFAGLARFTSFCGCEVEGSCIML